MKILFVSLMRLRKEILLLLGAYYIKDIDLKIHVIIN
jgi:hypothetical protein